ncbi:M23 family metallopeptidase, partial [Candidatus Woesearchaeota archaeon]|nr:M23 family metallopeptidase [Candidatus Woesearchaeota archaeon]
MNRRGKIATLGIIIFYLLASLWGLYVVYTEFLGGGIEAEAGYAVGDYQGAMLAAYGRADANRFYLHHAALLAIDEAGKDLYEDPLSVLERTEGDDVAGCDVYTYPLLPACLNDSLTESFAAAVLERLGTQMRAGGLSVPYTIDVKDGLVTELRSGPLEEPILYGLRGEDAQQAANQLEGTNTQGLSWPSEDSRGINSCFGLRDISYGSREHHGLDINGQNRVLAAMDGTVIGMDPKASSQGTVWIQHSPSLSTRYLHLIKNTITVKPGDTVKRGQYLGTAAHTGCWKDKAKTDPCGDHLHFEVLVTSTPQQSSHAYSQDSTPGWYAVNPVCFFPEETLDAASLTHVASSCRSQGNWKESYCDEYGFTLTESQSYQPGTSLGKNESGDIETTEESAIGEDAVQPDNSGLTVDQQRKFATTEQNRYTHKWDGHVVSASTTYGVDQALILGVITQESLGDPLAISPTSCAGIMQICYPTGKNLPGLGVARMTECSCAGKGPGCACTVENDYRLHADVAIPAGTYLLKENLQRFSHYKDQVAFAVGAYNIGPGIIQQGINGAGTDPSW